MSSLTLDDGSTAVLEPIDEASRAPGRLRDKFGRAITDLRVSVTDRCNYKCVYCRTGNEGAQYTELAIADYHADGAVVRLAGSGEDPADRRRAVAAVGTGGDGARAVVDADCYLPDGTLCWRCGSAARSCSDHEWTSAGGTCAAVEGRGAESCDRQYGRGGCGDLCGDHASAAELRQGAGWHSQGTGGGAWSR